MLKNKEDINKKDIGKIEQSQLTGTFQRSLRIQI